MLLREAMSRLNIKKVFGVVIVLCAVALLPRCAMAAVDTCYTTPHLPQTLMLTSSIAVDSSLPNGSVIPNTVKSIFFTGYCTHNTNSHIYAGAPVIACYYGNGSEIGTTGQYTTGVNGVGISLLINGVPLSGAGGVGTGIYCNSQNTPVALLSARDGQGHYNFSFTVTLELIKTTPAGTPISPGSLNLGSTGFGFGVYQSNLGLDIGDVGSGSGMNVVSYGGSLNIKSVACNPTFNPSTRIVTLPNASVSQLPNAGSTYGLTPFSFAVTCPNTEIFLTLTPVIAPPVGSPTGGFGISTGGTNASNVILQITNAAGTTAKTLSTRQDLGNTGSNSTYNFTDYAVRYYSLGNPTPGYVSGLLNFLFDYQ